MNNFTENSYPICFKSLKFALENLCSIKFGSVSTNNLSNKESTHLKYFLSELVVISLEKIMECDDMANSLVSSGIVSMTLRVLENITFKLLSEVKNKGTGTVLW